MTDEQLVERMADGDQAAFEVLIHRYHGPLLGYLERHLYNRERAEDFVQETFLRLIRQLKKGRLPEQIRPWLYRVALNLCRDYWKSLGFQNEKQQIAETPDRRDEGPSVVEIYERQETRKEILMLLHELGELQKEIIILRFYQDLKLHEISEIMEIPLSTVKTNLYQGLKRLRSRLIKEGVQIRYKKEGENTYA